MRRIQFNRFTRGIVPLTSPASMPMFYEALDKIKKLDEELSRMGAPIASPEHIKSWEAWFNKKSIADEQSHPGFSKQTRQELKAYRQKLRKLQAKIQKRMANVDSLIGCEDDN